MTGLTHHLLELRAALLSGNDAVAARTAQELSARAAEDFPSLHAAVAMLGYHGQLALLNEVMARAWPQVQDGDSFSRPAVSAYASRAADHVIYQYLETTPEPAGDDPDLLEALERYFPVDAGRLDTYFAFLRGESGRRWRAEDFADLEASALGGLLVEFVGLAHRAGVSYGKAHLVRDHLPRYFLDRQAGYLYPREDVAALLRGGRRPPPALTAGPAEPLVPDRLTLLNFLQRLVQTVQPQPYAAAALVELMPLWLRFLTLRGLITTDTHDEAASDLEGLAEEMAAVWEGTEDPILAGNVLGEA